VSLFDEIKMTARYTRGLPAFLRKPLKPEDCRRLIEERMAARNESFLAVVKRGIFQNPRSPYRTLFEWAGVSFTDVARWTRECGVEGTLERLLEAGVSVRLPEFKGRQAMERDGRSRQVKAEDFDNPLVRAHFSGRSGGSRGPARRLLLDLDLLTHDAACHFHHMQSVGALDRPFGVWRSVPPDNSGMKKILMNARLGLPTERWFAQAPLQAGHGQFKFFFFTWQTIAICRLFGREQAAPEHVPMPEAIRVAEWLADCKRRGRPGYLDTMSSCAVRVCQAAEAAGLDIGGTVIRTGGEALTPAKAGAIVATGCRVICHYSMSELGPVAMACADGAAVDDVHILLSKVAIIRRADGALLFTSLDPSCPKQMFNTETGDTATMEQRSCGCVFGELGFDLHLRGIRSYEKLTSEGTHFLGMELLALLEEVLPKAFGGAPSDYQLVEEEERGLSRVTLVVSPRIGAVDEEQVRRTALGFLSGQSRGHGVMTSVWQDGSTLRVARREPYVTGAGKILPLHINS
jgi:hypothetical protein